jgi:hypothetical protein
LFFRRGSERMIGGNTDGRRGAQKLFERVR